jgi:hypothetical protein
MSALGPITEYIYKTPFAGCEVVIYYKNKYIVLYIISVDEDDYILGEYRNTSIIGLNMQPINLSNQKRPLKVHMSHVKLVKAPSYTQMRHSQLSIVMQAIKSYNNLTPEALNSFMLTTHQPHGICLTTFILAMFDYGFSASQVFMVIYNLQQ